MRATFLRNLMHFNPPKKNHELILIKNDNFCSSKLMNIGKLFKVLTNKQKKKKANKVIAK